MCTALKGSSAAGALTGGSWSHKENAGGDTGGTPSDDSLTFEFLAEGSGIGIALNPLSATVTQTLVSFPLASTVSPFRKSTS